jgi:hypothetical protein
MSEEQCEGLQAATIKGSIEDVEKWFSVQPDLINIGLNINGSHALIFANPHPELTKYLIARGSNVNKPNKVFSILYFQFMLNSLIL